MAQNAGSRASAGVTFARGAGEAVTHAATAAEAKFLALSETLEFAYFPYFYADGATDYALDITLPRNALVDQLDTVVTAARAFSVPAQVVAQVRTASISGGKSVVLDFGTLRTVSAVTLPLGFAVQRLSIWNGLEFRDENLVRELQIGLSHPLDAAVLERQPQVVEVWLAMEARTVTGNTTLSSPGSIVVIHGVAKLDTDVIVWSRADNDDLLARVLSSGGRLIIRIHCGHLLDHERRPFSSSLDGVLGSQSPHAPGGVHETWMFVRGG